MGAAKRRGWPWLEFVVLPLTAALMRVAWLTPLVRFALDNEFVSPRGVPFPSWLILILLFGSSLLVEALRDHPRGARLIVVVGLAAIAGVVALTFRLDLARPGPWLREFTASQGDFRQGLPAVFIVVVAAAAIWWRGMTAVWHDYTELFGGFVTGVVVLGGLMLAAGQADWAERGLDVWASVIVFVLSGLSALALLAVYEMLTWERFRGRGGPGLSRYWLTAVGTLVASILLTGWAVGRLMSLGLGGTLASLWQPIGRLLERAVELVLLAWGYVVFELFAGLISILQAIVERNWDLIVGFLQRFVGVPAESVEEVAQPSDAAQLSLRILFWLVLVFTVGVLFYIAFRRYKRAWVEGDLEDREFILTGELLVEQLRSIIRGLRRRRPMAPFLQLEEIEDARRVIRALYRRMLERMGALGYARLPSDTPRAYERSVAGVVRGERQALNTLTEAYLVARYSPDPPTPEQVEEARGAYARLEDALGHERPRDD